MTPALRYRADLQGLRAIAVTIVILAHANAPGFAGGFVGVDVFFVLSGYLITGLLVEERLASGSIHYGRFLARRLRRLLPALLAMVLVVFLIAPWVLSSYEARLQTGSFMFAATWTSNFYFSFAEFNYFAALRSKDLFLHTWSLGVEEQFYLVWPWLMLLVLGWKLPSLAQDSPGTSKAQASYLMPFVAIGLVFVSSLSLCLYWSETSPILSFYMMPARGWQFALGAAVFLYARFRPEQSVRLQRSWGYMAGVLGMMLILGSAALLHSKLTYPGYLALIPSSGAALVLLSGVHGGETRITHILSHDSFVWVGDRSYSLYLWHWPVLLIGDAYGLRSGISGAVALILTSVVLAAFSYRFVERPFWKGRFSVLPYRTVGLSSMLAMLLIVAGNNFFVTDIFTGAPVHDIRSSDAAREAGVRLFRTGMDCDAWYSHARVEPCKVGNPDASHRVVLIGDSIGAQWATFLPEIYSAPEWEVQVLTKSACAIVDVEYYYDSVGGLYDVCTEWREASFDYLADLKPDIVFLGSSASYDFSSAEWTEGTTSVLERLSKISSAVVVIAGTPALSFDGSACIRQPYRFTTRLRDSRRLCEEAMSSDVSEVVARYLRHATGDVADASLLYLNDLVCPNERCAAMTEDGSAIFRDETHLTAGFVYQQIPSIKARLEAISATPSQLTADP